MDQPRYSAIWRNGTLGRTGAAQIRLGLGGAIGCGDSESCVEDLDAGDLTAWCSLWSRGCAAAEAGSREL